MLTYEKIIKESKDFAANHVQISSFDNGDLWEVIESNTLQDYSYPLLFMNDGQSTLNQGVLTFSFNILAVDQVLNGEVNENFVKSSMHQLCLDYLAYFKHTYMYDVEGTKLTFRIEPTASLVSFTERFNDTLTGWNMSVIFRIPFDASKCNIPLRNNPPTPTPFECADAILTLNSGTFLTVESGSTTNIVLIDQNDDPITPTSVVGSTIKVNAGVSTGDVTVNGDPFGTYTAPTTFAINVFDGEANPYLGIDLIAPDIYIPPIAINVNTIQIAEVFQGSYSFSVLNENSDQVGGISGLNWLIADSAISVNGTAYADVNAEDSLNVEVVNTEATVLSGSIVAAKYEMPDVELSFVVDGGAPVSETVPYQKNETINIVWL